MAKVRAVRGAAAVARQLSSSSLKLTARSFVSAGRGAHSSEAATAMAAGKDVGHFHPAGWRGGNGLTPRARPGDTRCQHVAVARQQFVVVAHFITEWADG
jgi:hypothetical protein